MLHDDVLGLFDVVAHAETLTVCEVDAVSIEDDEMLVVEEELVH